MSQRRAVAFDATGTLFEATESVGEVYARIARDHGIELPAWRGGSLMSPKPARGPEDKSRRSLAIFFSWLSSNF